MEQSPPTLSGKESIVLDLLLGRGEMYGLELVEAAEGRLKRGTVYVTLGRMEDKGYVESRQEERRPGSIGLPRRLYRVTLRGRRIHDAWGALRQTLAWEGAR
jgi:PadR family transcriptional regulator, regulatory protein PadR